MRWRALATTLLLGSLSCGGPTAKTAPPAPALHLAPLADIVPAGGLTWLVVAEPRRIAQDALLIPAIAQVLSEERLKAFTDRTGGLDPRGMEELVVASYGDSTLIGAREPLDPGRIEAAFKDHALHLETRSLERPDDDPRGVIVRIAGTDAAGHIELALLGREAALYAVGRPAPLRAAELFAAGKIRRASPALKSEPLQNAATSVGEAPVRAFAPGPFVGEWKQGLGGLLGASTAAAMAVRVSRGAEDAPRLAFTFALLGAWGKDAALAGKRLAAELDLVAQSALGRLLGFDHPAQGPEVRAGPDALVVEVAVDAFAFARGLHAATGARVDEMMAP